MIPLTSDFMAFMALVYGSLLFTAFVIWFLSNIAEIFSKVFSEISRMVGD